MPSFPPNARIPPFPPSFPNHNPTTHPLEPLFDPTLAAHLSHLPPSTLETLSRFPPSIFTTTSLPVITQIELVNSTAFTTYYDALYRTSFPHDPERESTDRIVARLDAESAHQRDGLAPYRIIGLRTRDEDGAEIGIGAAQFSMLFLPEDDDKDGEDGEKREVRQRSAVPYLQYLYIDPRFRRRNLAEVLHTLTLAVATADALARSVGSGRRQKPVPGTESVESSGGETAGRWSVPFTLFETEPPGHGDTEEARRVATQRIHIHTRGGAVGVMYRRRRQRDLSDTVKLLRSEHDGSSNKDDGDPELITPHCQPGLEVGEQPITLLWAIRPSPAYAANALSLKPHEPVSRIGSIDVNEIGMKLVKAYYQSLRDEGFLEANIKTAEEIVQARCRDGDFVAVRLEDCAVHDINAEGKQEKADIEQEADDGEEVVHGKVHGS